MKKALIWVLALGLIGGLSVTIARSDDEVADIRIGIRLQILAETNIRNLALSAQTPSDIQNVVNLLEDTIANTADLLEEMQDLLRTGTTLTKMQEDDLFFAHAQLVRALTLDYETKQSLIPEEHALTGPPTVPVITSAARRLRLAIAAKRSADQALTPSPGEPQDDDNDSHRERGNRERGNRERDD